ncbi:MAG: nucleotidyltransferase family protein [Actinobacteria bacterium]|nr:nucleotidyltransferase family protein [Actinomycetota bacterium]MBI3687422.1 nucleotidyltransferase family protein [Actinomycetota bacterium]
MTSTEPAPSQVAAEALRELCWGSTPETVSRGVRTALGPLLELVIEHKLVCLLADHVAAAHLDSELSRPLARFFAGTLRTNWYKTRIYRRETTLIMDALGRHSIPVAAMNGVSVEKHLYGGRGGRQFSDLDLLVHPDDYSRTKSVLTDLGYQRQTASSAMTRTLDDLLVDISIVDVVTRTAHADTPDHVRAVLDRRQMRSVPGHEQPLPVLAASDALAHCLARLTHPGKRHVRWAVCADALRLHHRGVVTDSVTREPAVHRGWDLLRGIWPQLPAAPCESDHRRERP